MERDSTNRERTADELRALGASEDFITVYFTEYEGRHSVVAELDGGFGGTCIDSDERDFDPSIGGGYFNALWSHGANRAWSVGDGNNRQILKKAFTETFK